MGTGEVPGRTRPSGAWSSCGRRTRLDQGAGTAWAGDARQGFHGGAFGLRWVRGEALAYGAGDLERQVLAAADPTRAGGGFVRLALDPGRVPVGRSVAPLAVAAFALADERFGTGIGPLEPARAVR